MNIVELDRKELADGVLRINFKLSSADFLYMGYLLESMEGLCTYTTPEGRRGVMQVDVVPDFAKDFEAILEELKRF